MLSAGGTPAFAAVAAAVGAFLALQQHLPGFGEPTSTHTNSLGQASCQQQQHQPHIQEVLAAHKQPVLLALLRSAPSIQQDATSSRTLQHSWQQLWPSQRRALCSSFAPHGSSRDSQVTWPDAVPPLHQPHKHVTGSRPVKPDPAAASPAAAPAADKAAADAAASPAAGQSAAESFLTRHRAKLTVGVLFITTGATLFTLLRAIILHSIPGGLRTNEAVTQKNQLRYLRWALRLRKAVGEAVVQQLAEHGALAALVGVVQPGTDALVLVEACEVLKELRDSPTALAAMKQDGLLQALDSGLSEGWVPTGALKAVQTLQRMLQVS